MAAGRSVLVIGLQPTLIDFSSPDYSASGLNAAKVQAAIDADTAKLNSLGYDAHICLTDFGETAEAVVLSHLKQKRFDCVLIGAGVRTIGTNFFLFEKLLNIVHEHAPQAKLCFNTRPNDTADAVQRWL